MEEPNKSFFDDTPKEVAEEVIPEAPITEEDGAASDDGEQERIPHEPQEKPYEGRGESLAMFSVVLGLSAFVCCGLFASLGAIITALSARRRMKRMNGMAFVGLLLGIIHVVITALAVVLVLVLAGIVEGTGATEGVLLSLLTMR